LNLLDTRDVLRSVFVHPEGSNQPLTTLVISGEAAARKVAVQEDGTLVVCHEPLNGVQDFENRFHVNVTYRAMQEPLKAQKERLKVDIDRFMNAMADATSEVGITNSDRAEEELLKAGTKQAFIVWKQIMYGTYNHLDRADGDVMISVRYTKDGRVTHYTCSWQEGTLFVEEGGRKSVVHTFTTRECLSKDAIYAVFQKSGFGIPLHIAREQNAKRQLCERLVNGLYLNHAQLSEMEGRLGELVPTSRYKTPWYSATLQPEGATQETWQTLTIKKYSPSSSMIGSLLGSWDTSEQVVHVNPLGKYVHTKKFQKKETVVEFDAADFIGAAAGLHDVEMR
ncbi:MAG TPA: hypothetical protein VN457_07180, partial [Chlamydiales bacterium]|nr:hypothetical protein [Chlamydiales bacterium]